MGVEKVAIFVDEMGEFQPFHDKCDGGYFVAEPDKRRLEDLFSYMTQRRSDDFERQNQLLNRERIANELMPIAERMARDIFENKPSGLDARRYAETAIEIAFSMADRMILNTDGAEGGIFSVIGKLEQQCVEYREAIHNAIGAIKEENLGHALKCLDRALL